MKSLFKTLIELHNLYKTNHCNDYVSAHFTIITENNRSYVKYRQNNKLFELPNFFQSNRIFIDEMNGDYFWILRIYEHKSSYFKPRLFSLIKDPEPFVKWKKLQILK